ncbi:piwi-like protein Ago3 isoform X2 [Periplaneta americana]|uniref:piwi-like protein Ago3 isoform X2 n=1 Tax=Periplaneta americana TaxID=6978 RepID=UPI0037E8164C
MAGRGGRGAAILEALLAQQRKPGEESASSEAQSEAGTSQTSAGAAAAAPALPTPGGRGRAAILASLSTQIKAKVPEEVTPTPGPSVPAGRGRAALLQALAQGRGSTPTTPGSESSAQHSRAQVRDVEPPVQRMGQMSLQEKPPVSLQEKPPVHRTGESGKQIRATANYIRLNLEPGKGVYEYEVRFEPQLDSRGMRFKLLNEHAKEFGGTKTFDGVTLYLPIKLQQEATVYSSSHPVDNTPVMINVIFKRQKKLGECIHLYNVLFRRIMNVLDLARIGRQHFSPANAHPIPQHKLEVWPGYVTAVDEYEGGIQLCCDSSHRVLRTQTVHELMHEIVVRNPNNFKDVTQKAIIGASVLTRYNNKMYRIDDIDWNQTPSSTFSTQSGDTISFQQYYKKQYDIDIRDEMQPLLLNRLKRKIRGEGDVEQMVCLVPELCHLTGLTDEMRSDFRVMKDISMYTRITPNQRQAALKKFIRNITENDRALQLLADWGLRLDQNTVDLNARLLESENVIFGDQVVVKGSPQADWGAAATRNKVLTAVDLINWMIIHAPRDSRFANEFAGKMRNVGPQMGIEVCAPRIMGLRDDRTDSYLRMLRENISPSLQLVVIIFPTARDDRYAAVKKLCCADMPIASQVINSRTLSKPDKLRSVVQKIALQINCKLGGTLWAVRIPLENCMVCGIDSYHDASKRGGSVAGFVASLNPTLTRWFSKVCFQGPGQELVDGLKTCLISSLKYYYEVNHRFPDRIVIYRDGVGDGQLRVSADYEVPQFESCFQHIGSEYHPKLTVVICQKRINTRIFSCLNGGSGDGGLGNPCPGTIVDHTITRRNWYDFFLVSQHVRQVSQPRITDGRNANQTLR